MTPTHPVLEPIRTAHLDLPNRVAVAPMSRVSTAGDGVPTEKMADYYAEYAPAASDWSSARERTPTTRTARRIRTSRQSSPANRFAPGLASSMPCRRPAGASSSS